MPSDDDQTADARRKLLQDAVAALKGGNKLEAIKIVRAATGAGLAEAKKFADELDKRVKAKEGAAIIVASAPSSTPLRRPGLAPGEVPRDGSPAKWVALIALVAIALLTAHFLGYFES